MFANCVAAALSGQPRVWPGVWRFCGPMGGQLISREVYLCPDSVPRLPDLLGGKSWESRKGGKAGQGGPQGGSKSQRSARGQSWSQWLPTRLCSQKPAGPTEELRSSPTGRVHQLPVQTHRRYCYITKALLCPMHENNPNYAQRSRQWQTSSAAIRGSSFWWCLKLQQQICCTCSLKCRTEMSSTNNSQSFEWLPSEHQNVLLQLLQSLD